MLRIAPFFVALVIMTGCVSEASDSDAEKALTPQPASQPVPPLFESVVVTGSIAPASIVETPLSTTSGVAQFTFEPTMTWFNITLSTQPLVSYSLQIYSGPERALIYDEQFMDRKAWTLSRPGVTPPYEIAFDGGNTPEGFDWRVNVTQGQWHNTDVVNATQLAERVRRSQLSDNTTQWHNGTSSGLPTSEATGAWSAAFAALGNRTVIEVRATSQQVLPATVIVRDNGTEFWQEDGFGGEDFHLLALGGRGDITIEVLPERGEPELTWMAAVTRFGEEDPPSNWRALPPRNE